MDFDVRGGGLKELNQFDLAQPDCAILSAQKELRRTVVRCLAVKLNVFWARYSQLILRFCLTVELYASRKT